MYIKQVIIQGFKSYREQTVVEPFDPRHNVVVGRNGSGKSNFFYAIQFVLSDEFSHLRPEQRQALLHEGTGPRVLNAYVEIIFDNADGRLPIDKDEVYLRRVIGAKKDQYFLNKKVVPRSDVMNLLESAGFSRSNPYYIVKQGKINQMATAPDSHRLKLLREVAGTRVYDERREESKAILKETESKVEKIEEFLRTIEERLKTLEEEKEELKEYQKWDRMRRSLEYTIHDRELKETRKKLTEMEAARKNSGEVQKKWSNELKKAQENIRQAARSLKEAKKKVQTIKEERDTLSAEYQQLLKEKTKLELTIKDLSDEVMGDNTSKERAENELRKLKDTIAQREADLEQIKPRYEEMKKKEEECTRDLALKEQKRKELYAKQGRGSQFTSKEERDQWIMKELRSLNKQIKDKKEHSDRLTEDMKRDAEKHMQLEKKIQEQTLEMERQRGCIDEHNKQFYELKKNKDQCQSTRNELWRKENTLQQTLSSLKEDLAKADQSLRSMAGKPILNGRDSVRKVLETLMERGGAHADTANSYYGPVIENFSCDKRIYTAVEVTAGNRLFHHIVDSDKVGTQILKEMNRQKLPGEVTFMPLNRLHVKEQNYPDSADATPMVIMLRYEEKYDKALRYIFGKTLICRNLEVATNLAKTNGLDCVTLEGDQVSSKGSLTGGYFNTSRSRLEIQKNRTELNNQIEEAAGELAKLKENLREIEGKINNIVSEMQKTETKTSKAKDIFDKVKADIRLMKEELTGIERYRVPKERSLDQYASSLEAMKTTKEGLESELHQELMSQLSVQDQLEVDKLNDDIRRLTQENKEAFSTRMRLEAEKNKLENLLTNNLMRRHDELMQALQEISVEDRKRQLDNCKSELAAVEKRLDQVQHDLKKMGEQVQTAMKEQKSEQASQDEWKIKEKEIQEKIEEDAKDLEKMASKQNMLEQKIQDCTKKIQDLGSLPSPDIYAKYQNLSTKNLFKELEKANGHLKKYSHVNKKALDQFMSFSEQKDKLVKRKEELDRGDEKIKELMNVLEQRKYEAIEFTFKQVSKNFSEVFHKLVPSGHAQLVMKKSEEEGGEAQGEGESDRFTGVGIRVSFTGRNAEMREMNQLSGGQKSLVALGLIFAIQKCDPAPFYLFDEIDQALDSQHRNAVAEMIHELSKDAQFITTTFRPELLVHANKFYGVKFRNKIITKTSIHHLATLTEKDLEEWIIAFQSIAFKDNLSKQTIEEDNDLYCSSVDGVFSVKLVSSEASTRCNLEPAIYVLVIASASLHLHDSKNHRLLFTWPFRYIRRYGYREGKFTFEAGRKCETGEGTFHFEHSNQQDIFRCMSTKMKRMRKLLTGESTSTPVIICGDNQFQAALSMEARSRSPLPPSPTSATPYGDLANISGSQSTTKFSTVDSVTLSNPPVPKPKPIKPPRKSLINTNVEKTEDSNAENCSVGKLRVFPPSESSVPLLLTTSSLTSFYLNSNNSPLIIGSDTVSDGYDKVEVRREAWRTLGIDDVNHTEKANPESDVEEDGLESILKHSGSRMPNTNDTFTTNQSSKILLPQISCKSDASENYDTLQHFGSTSRLNNNPGYRYIPPIFPTTSGNTESVTQNLSQKNYDEVVNSMQACRLADDSHYGYGMIRKKSTPSESDLHENLRPNHEVHNELEYAIVQKSKRV